MAERFNNIEDYVEDDVKDVHPSNPIEQRDTRIAELEKNVAEMSDMKENV